MYNIDSNLIQAISEFPQTLSICLIGSITRDYQTEAGDIDLLILMDKDINCDELLTYLQTKFPLLSAILLDDIIRINNYTIPVSLSVMSIEFLRNTINNISRGKIDAPSYKMWTVIGYVPEVICADVLDCHILSDKNGDLQRIKNYTHEYPKKLACAVLDYSIEELTIKIRMAQKSHSAEDDITCNITIVSSTLSIVRSLLAIKRIYFRGMKHLKPQVSRYLPEYLPLIECLILESSKSIEKKLLVLEEIAIILRDQRKLFQGD